MFLRRPSLRNVNIENGIQLMASNLAPNKRVGHASGDRGEHAAGIDLSRSD